MAFSYARINGSFSSDLGQLLALRDGLLLAKRFRIPVSIAEVSSSAVVSSLSSPDVNLGDSHFIVNDVKALFSLVGIGMCQASSYKGNSLARNLASLAFSSSRALKLIICLYEISQT
jgi:hypothetical protein